MKQPLFKYFVFWKISRRTFSDFSGKPDGKKTRKVGQKFALEVVVDKIYALKRIGFEKKMTQKYYCAVSAGGKALKDT